MHFSSIRPFALPVPFACAAFGLLLAGCGGGGSDVPATASARIASTQGTTAGLSAASPAVAATEQSLGAGLAASLCNLGATAKASSTAWGTFKKPYAASAPWNSRPEGVVLGTAVVPTSLYFPSVASGPYSSEAFKATASDGPVTITGPDSRGVWDPDSEVYRPSVTIPRWPAGVVPATGSDGHAEVVDTVSGVVHSFFKLRQVGTGWQAAQYAWTSLGGRGMGDPAHYFQGARAAGVSTLGGLMRKHEVNDGDTMYRHALAMSLTYNGLSPSPTYQFPATSSDTNAATANSGQIPMGSLMMLPAGFDAQALATPELRKVAETLKTYGAYVVDRNYGTPFVIYVENGADFKLHKNGWSNPTAADLELMRQALRPLASADAWLDGNDQSFDPMAPMNLLSMRGYWYRTKGTVSGEYDTWRQAVVFPSTTMPIEQVNAGGRAYSGVTWALPTVGASYRLTAVATGGARFRMTLADKVTGVVAYDSGDLADGQSTEFPWPLQNFKLSTYAKSGVGGVESSVRAELVAASPAVSACRP